MVSVGRRLARGPGRGRPGRPVRPPGPPAGHHPGPRDRRAGRGAICSSPCKDRRAAVCPSCSRLYQADAWQLVAAGIRGGKGVDARRRRAPPALRHPDRPVVRARAPRRCSDGRPRLCRPRASAGLCPHGRSLSCIAAPRRRTTLRSASRCAPSASTTAGAVLWNAHVSRAVGPDLAPPLPRGRPGGRAERPPSCARWPASPTSRWSSSSAAGSSTSTSCSGPTAAAGPAEPPPPWLDAAVLTGAVAAAVAERRRRRAGRLDGYGAAPGPLGRPARRPGARGRRRERRRRPSPPTWPSTPPRRRTGRPWLAHPIRSAGPARAPRHCGPTSCAWCATAWALGAAPGAGATCACATTPTPSATPGSSPPRACASRPPSGRCARPGPTTSRASGDGRLRLRRRVALRRPGLRATPRPTAWPPRCSRRPPGPRTRVPRQRSRGGSQAP